MGLRSIRWRLVVSYVLLALLAVSVVGFISLTLLRNSLEQQELTGLTTNAEAIARQAFLRMGPLARHSDLGQLVQTSAFLGNVRVRILDVDQKTVLADSGPREQSGVAMWVEPGSGLTYGSSHMPLSGPLFLLPSGKISNLPADGSVTITSVRRVDTPWGSMLVFETSSNPSDGVSAQESPTTSAAPPSGPLVLAAIGSNASPVAFVEVSGGPDLVSPAVSTTSTAFLWAALIAALIAAVVGLFVGRGLTAPLSGLSRVASQMSAGDLSVRAPAAGKDEIGQLANQFNHMAEGLEASFKQLSAERDALRRFVADASHELRTPITALQTFTDLLQGSAANDTQARGEFLAESQKQLARLEWITHNLLDLSRLDAGIESLDLAQNEAGDLTRSVTTTFEPLAKEKNIDLSLSLPPEPVELRCDRARVEMALANLLHNALKFTPPGGQVSVLLESEEKLVRWSVQDNGPGIQPEDQPHIFERFFRGPHPGVDGSGLGLAIVHSIIQAHNGKVWLESTPGAGSKFIFELPRQGMKP
jgi:signal transduction histidine kinase